MSSTYGNHLKLSIFGQSHGAGIGMVLDGIPAGLPVDADKLQLYLNRRAPGQNDYSTPRKEEDQPELLSGILNGFTCGAPISALIRNHNTRSGDYDNLKDCPRPGHADYTAQMKYHGYQDSAGGGHFSGRLTAPLCIAGGMCLQWLETYGIQIGAHIASIGSVADVRFDPMNPQLYAVGKDFPVINSVSGLAMRDAVAAARASLDSIGGIVECAIVGLPVGLGEPMFGGMESRIAQIVYGIPAVKGVEFGDGFACSRHLGSENNDAFAVIDGTVQTATNHSGGILGGISNGMPVVFRAAFKPTPSIAQPQQSVSLQKMENQELTIKGRHDPCIVPRAVPVVEAAAAIAVMDLLLENGYGQERR